MSRTLNLTRLKDALKIIIVSLLGCSGIVFVVLYIDAFNVGFWYDYSTHLTAISVSIITTLTVLAITFFKSSNKIIFKLSFLSIVFILITMLSLYLFKISGLLDNFNNVKDFKEYIKSFEQYAIVLFVLVQFLQVVALPIPSFITVAAGVLLFGPLKAAMYSSVGIILGSIVAYFIGRVFGVKVVKWLVGENNLKKGLKIIDGKDKIVLTFMFLFPFFPDDVLCFISGLTTMSPLFFIAMIAVTRVVSIFTASYSLNNSIIPYDTWWGILLWVLFFVVTAVLTYFVCIKSDKLGKIFKQRKNTSVNYKRNND